MSPFIRYTPEPVILLYLFGAMMQLPVMQQYVYSRYSEQKGFIYEYAKQSSSCGGDKMNDTQKKLQEEVQSLAARFNIGHSLFMAIPSMISCLFYGALSDIIGRRKIMIISCIGAFIDVIITLLTMILKLPVYTIFLGAFFNGIGGAFTGMSMIALAYLADITEKEKLPMRMAILESVNLLGLCISNYASGPFIQTYSFIPPEIFIATLYASAVLFVIFILKESLNRDTVPEDTEKVNKLKLKDILSQPKKLWKVVSKKREKRWALYLASAILVLGYCFTIGVITIITLYFLNRPFCWPAIEIGNFLGTQMVMLAFGTVLGIKVLLKFLPEYFVAFVSPGFGIASFVMIALARTKTVAYLAIVVRGFGVLHTPIFRATISRIVDVDEQGSIFAAVSILEIFFVFIGNLVFNSTYSALNRAGKADLFFFIPAALSLIPMFATLIFWLRWRQEGNTSNVHDWERLENEKTTVSNTVHVEDCEHTENDESTVN